MTTSALAMLLITEAIVIGFTSYFLYRVLTAKPKPEPDSFSDNDEGVH
jgi:hypothetical protein